MVERREARREPVRLLAFQVPQAKRWCLGGGDEDLRAKRVRYSDAPREQVRASRGAKPRRRGLGDGPGPGTDLTADLTPPTDLPQLRSQSHPPNLPHPILTSPPRLSPPPHLPDLPHPYPYLTSPPSQHLPHLPTYLTSLYADIPLTSPPHPLSSPLPDSPAPPSRMEHFPPHSSVRPSEAGAYRPPTPPSPRFTSILTSSPPPPTSPAPHPVPTHHLVPLTYLPVDFPPPTCQQTP